MVNWQAFDEWGDENVRDPSASVLLKELPPPQRKFRNNIKGMKNYFTYKN